MAIYFIQAAVIAAAGLSLRVRSSRWAKRGFLILVFGLLILVAALRSQEIGSDLASHYARNYVRIASYRWQDIPRYSARTTYEIGYCYFTKLLSLINPSVQFYIVVTSVIIYGVLGIFFYRNSVDVRMSTLLLIFSCTYYNYMNIIRQALAGSLILIGYEIMKQKDKKVLRYLIFTLFVLLAASIHLGSVLCLVMILFDRLRFQREQIVLGLLASVLFFVLYQQAFELALRLFGLEEAYAGYLTKAEESVGHLNKQSIYMFLTVFIGFALGCFWLVAKRRRRGLALAYGDSFLLFAGMVASVCRVMVFRMNIINRYSYFFMPFVLLLYPRAIQEIRSVRLRLYTRIAVYAMMLIYFVWMTFQFEATFHRTVPYQFFWQQ